jgi:uncharacterized protein YcfJ
MKERVTISTLLGALALATTVPVAAQSWGPDSTSYSANARVVSAVPIRETVASAPRQECWTEYSDGSGGNRAAGAVIGGIAGGLIGHQFGSGSGNTAATIAGALGGAAVGNEIARRSDDPRAVERCRTVSDSSDRVVGYDVVYRFQGREFTARLPYDPGPELPVNVTVAPSR